MGIDPATISIIMSAASAVTGVVGSIQQSNAAKSQAEYQAAVARNNQIYAQRAADEAKQRGAAAEAKARMATKGLQGRQRAVLASNGLDVSDGSALDIQQDTAGLGEIDALTIRSNAEREAQGYLQQGSNFGGEAALYDARARNAASSGMWSGATTILGGAGSVAQKWYQLKGNTWGSNPGISP